MRHSSIKAMVLLVGLVFSLISSCRSQRIPDTENGGTSVSPYSLIIEQTDGTQLEVMGKGNMNDPYTETLDGYTVLRNNEGIYEYAVAGSKNRLEPGGIKANNAESRTRRERKYLKTIDKHLRNPDQSP